MQHNLTPRPKSPAAGRSLLMYTICHLLTDTLCFFFLFGSLLPFINGQGHSVWALPVLVIYNGLAFGLQFIWGLLADRFPKLPTGLIGMSLIGLGFLPRLITQSPSGLPIYIVTLILIGSGNSAFHVEGGRDSLSRANGSESRTGIYAAGGAAGVMIGTALGTVPFARYFLFPLWLAALIALRWLKREAIRAQDPYFSVALESTPYIAGSFQMPITGTASPFPPLQSLDSARTAKVPGSLAVIATLFFFVQTLFIPSPAALAVRPDFTVLPLPTMFIFILATLLTASRLVGGFITYRLSATPFMLLAAFSTLPLLIPTGKSLWGIFLQAFALGVPTAWAAFQYYRVMPNRPALAYSLQKLPMFAAAFLLVIQQVLPISGHAVFGGTLLRNTMLILTWTSMLIIWIVCQRKNLKMEGI
ncbi:MAG: hypothetical protein ACOX2M_00585 [Fastidiosipilaceae bacterium]|jgi:MFS family permease